MERDVEAVRDGFSRIWREMSCRVQQFNAYSGCTTDSAPCDYLSMYVCMYVCIC